MSMLVYLVGSDDISGVVDHPRAAQADSAEVTLVSARSLVRLRDEGHIELAPFVPGAPSIVRSETGEVDQSQGAEPITLDEAERSLAHSLGDFANLPSAQLVSVTNHSFGFYESREAAMADEGLRLRWEGTAAWAFVLPEAAVPEHGSHGHRGSPIRGATEAPEDGVDDVGGMIAFVDAYSAEFMFAATLLI